MAISFSMCLDFMHMNNILNWGWIDIKGRVDAATQLRDGLENYTNGPHYPNFLAKYMPVFVEILKGNPVFISTSGEQVSHIREVGVWRGALICDRNSEIVYWKSYIVYPQPRPMRSHHTRRNLWTC